MKKLFFFSAAAILAVSALALSGCSEGFYEGKKVTSDSNLVYETSKFSCYSFNTKASIAPFDELIIVNEFPDLKIYFSKNPQKGYDYVASYVMDKRSSVTVLFKYTIQDNGYLLDYCTETGETFNLLIPFSPDIETKGLGQDVMDCLSDAYSNHGWVSVWAFIQTCFIPETAVALAAACVAVNI